MKLFKSFLTLVVMCFASTMFAQVGIELNPRFDDDSNREIVNADALCNTGDEPFYQFLCNFRDDDEFRQARTKLTDISYGYLVAVSDEDMPEGEMFEIFEEQWILIDDEGKPAYFPLSASWFDVEEDIVYYAEGEACDNESIAADFVYVFERIDGEWFLTSYLEPESDEEESDELEEEVEEEIEEE